MTIEEVKRAILDNPLDRIPNELKQKIEQDGMPFTDIHTHIFNFEDVPDKYLGIRIPWNPRFLRKVSNLLHGVVPRKDTDRLSRTAYFVQVFDDKSMESVYNRITKYYSSDSIFVTLMMDMGIGIKGNLKHDITQQMKIMGEVRNRHPVNILPYVSIDPRRENALDLFKQAFGQNGNLNYFGLKVYPSIGYLPSHPRLMQMFEICQEKRIPVLAHCSGATVHSSYRRIKNIEGTKFRSNGSRFDKPITKTFFQKEAYAQFFNHPRNWMPVLEKFDSLKLCLAHFGGPTQWKKFLQDSPDSWVPRIIDFIHRYENLYVDFAYTMYKDSYTRRLRSLLEDNQRIREKVLFGSDYYMLVREGHYRDLLADFRTKIGDRLMQQIAVKNTRKYLFG